MLLDISVYIIFNSTGKNDCETRLFPRRSESCIERHVFCDWHSFCHDLTKPRVTHHSGCWFSSIYFYGSSSTQSTRTTFRFTLFSQFWDEFLFFFKDKHIDFRYLSSLRFCFRVWFVEVLKMKNNARHFVNF